MLHTLGGPDHLGEVRQPKLLLLLAYLALEGVTPRRTLAQLFWPSAQRPLSNLSVALSTLRGALPGTVKADPQFAWATLETDLDSLLHALDADDEAQAAMLYRGAFLLGSEELSLGNELEEWLLSTREFAAERYRAALLRWAEASRDASAAHLADAAYRVPGAPPPDTATLQRLYCVLMAADHPSAADIGREADELEVPLTSMVAASRPRERAGSYRKEPEATTGDDNLPSEPSLPLSPRPPDLPGLPALPHRLVGREPERLEVRRLLIDERVRLITLHGPGGIGKTSLALQLAHELRAEEDGDDGAYAGGVAFVELEDTRDATELPFAVARALGRNNLTGRRGIEALREVLPIERTLLVLDNVEQVSGAPEFLQRALDTMSRLSVLTTSRELLGVPLEVAFTIEGLSVPDSAGRLGAESYDAVRLFRDVARRADAGFVLGQAQLPCVARICRAVGGSPLGIELAAAWVRAVPLVDLADEIESGVHLLQRTRMSGPARHASARASFERSWRRLEARQRRALAALSVFSGGFGLDDARAVAEVSIPAIARLVDAALLRVGTDDRYEQHPLVARFAREKLAARQEREQEVLDRHAARFLGDLATRSADLRVLRAGVLERLDQDFVNVRAAWRHAVENDRSDLIAAAAFPLMRYLDARARLQEGRALFAASLAVAPGGHSIGLPSHGRVLAALAWLDARLGDHQRAIEAGSRAEKLLAAEADQPGLRVARHALAAAHYRAGEYGEARRIFEGLAEEATDDPVYQAELLGRIGLVAQAVGEYDEARERYLAALYANRRLANVSGVVTQLLNLGALDLNTHAPQAAGERFEEALRLAREHGYQQVVPILLHNLANVACKAGRFAEARSSVREALGRVEASGERGLESGMLATLGWIELEAGDLRAAENHVRRAVEVARDIGDEPAEQTARVRLGQVMLAADREQQAVALLDSAAEHGATLTWARLLARRLREDIAF